MRVEIDVDYSPLVVGVEMSLRRENLNYILNEKGFGQRTMGWKVRMKSAIPVIRENSIYRIAIGDEQGWQLNWKMKIWGQILEYLLYWYRKWIGREVFEHLCDGWFHSHYCISNIFWLQCYSDFSIRGTGQSNDEQHRNDSETMLITQAKRIEE